MFYRKVCDYCIYKHDKQTPFPSGFFGRFCEVLREIRTFAWPCHAYNSCCLMTFVDVFSWTNILESLTHPMCEKTTKETNTAIFHRSAYKRSIYGVRMLCICAVNVKMDHLYIRISYTNTATVSRHLHTHTVTTIVTISITVLLCHSTTSNV